MPSVPCPPSATGSLVDAFGGRYYRIAHLESLPTFFMNVVSASDLWLFAASNGALTAGRGDADHALFPYRTVDQLYDSAGLTGPCTFVRTTHEGRTVVWEPFARDGAQWFDLSRHLYKSVEGDQVWFEEINHTLALAFRAGWATADEHGFIRRCTLENLSDAPRPLTLVDSLRNLLPPGILTRVQQQSSCLADAYKTAELLPGSTLAVYSLAAGIVDRAIPLESLRASAVWSHGLPAARVLLTDAQVEQARQGTTPSERRNARGVRCTYGLHTALTLAPRGKQDWMLVADTDLTQAQVAARRAALDAGTLPAAVGPDIAAATAQLRSLVGLADGLHAGADEIAAAHHFANTLFNVMRGGIFAHGAQVPAEDFAAFVRLHHRAVAERHAELLRTLPPLLSRDELLARTSARGDTDLARLAAEYLPLTFSRRHGDPSRPWNKFRIHVRDDHGRRVLAHEGNWRDIFQNWEALCLAFPAYYDAAIAKFLNASTLDGYNPYRVSHAGIDWEVPDHEDPWASIGYWGDHQVIYLQKLLEWSARHQPGRLHAALRQPGFSYADVPYRIAGFAEMRRQPRDTIRFDAERHRETLARVARDGTDARLVHDAAGRVVHVSLTEKLLVLVLTRLTNFVPGGGIWMNTQRPEWNDANNALVGYGVSFVTLCYLRRLLAHARAHLLPALGQEPVAISAPVLQLTRALAAGLAAHRPKLAQPLSDADRLAVLTTLAEAGTAYREHIYRHGPGENVALAPDEIRRLFDLALDYVDHTLRLGRRTDGLYESYSLLEFTDEELRVQPLYPMLEGQVAILSSGLLTPAEAVALLEKLRASPLYRADQHSYLLYPDRELPGFLARNRLAPHEVAANPLLRALADAGDPRLVTHDPDGQARFHADLVNDDALRERLQILQADPRWADAVHAHGAAVRALYEEVFNHRAFTGRSGSMFGYEGLGCIYWHMVAKLLLAVQENHDAALAAGAPQTRRLAEIYSDVRAGLGFNKSPAQYGAFPTDPYSHTPGHSGAQQPGMTGQVKEEILTRFGELGVQVRDGRLGFAPALLRAGEFTSAPTSFAYVGIDGAEGKTPLPAGALAFTCCGVPVIYHLSQGPARLRWRTAAGATAECRGTTLHPEISAEIFRRSGRIALVEVDLGDAFRPLPDLPR